MGVQNTDLCMRLLRKVPIISNYQKRQNGIKYNFMEELQKPNISIQEQLRDSANIIYQEIATQIIQLKGHSNSKSFFTSTAHQFLQRLIHLHCTELKRALVLQSKQIQKKIYGEAMQTEFDFNLIVQDLKILKHQILSKQRLFAQINKLFEHLIINECQGKSNYEIENIFLEINCSLNYTCPLCIKQSNSNQPKSTKLIKDQSEEAEAIVYPLSMKTISLRESEKLQRLPSLSKQSKLESILDSMKADRMATKKQQELKQKKINKIWSVLGGLMQLDRQKFIEDHFFNQNQYKQNCLLKQLQQKNIRNQHEISKFCKKKRPKLKEPIPDNECENAQKQVPTKNISLQKKVSRSISPKVVSRKFSMKKHVKILEPINNNIDSIDLKNKTYHQQNSAQLSPNRKTLKIFLIGEYDSLKNHSKQTKQKYFHRTFKSSKDMLATLSGDGTQFSDYRQMPLPKSLKMI